MHGSLTSSSQPSNLEPSASSPITTNTSLLSFSRFAAASSSNSRPHSRHVFFSPSTLEHVSHRSVLIKAETSAFQNFVNDMYEAYYRMQLSSMADGQGLGQGQKMPPSSQLSLKDLVLLQRLARDMWKHMKSEQRKHYVALAKEAQQRRRRRLPPDPYRSRRQQLIKNQ
ncbi:uncharacterized protein Dwil_GK19762 [Drosophila willistoni]|uniref:Uncharacterized protein n=2 Tax=Drosophila willistoni TaxID=7260 RepID=B4MXG3_DROWI|nr:uncharacterized protein Dwil_GK19762 [Drosophila willistoni]